MANFGDILTSLALGAYESVRRNAGDTAFEAYTAWSQTELDARYLKLDASNDPITGALELSAGLTVTADVTASADINPNTASGQDLGDATHRWDLYTQDVIFGGATTANVITVPDNIASALELVDGGGIEYLRLVTTDAQPVTHFNDGGADIDLIIESAVSANSFVFRGADGYIGLRKAVGDIGSAVDIVQIGLGHALKIYRDLASASTDNALVWLENDNAGDDQSVLLIAQDAPKIALDVTITAAAEAAYFSKDVATGITPVVTMVQDSATGTTPVLQLQQDDESEGTINFVASPRGVIAENVNSAESVRVELSGVVYRLALYADA